MFDQRAYRKKYYQDNKDRERELQKKYYENNKRHLKEKAKKYWQEHREHYKDLSKKWREENPEHQKYLIEKWKEINSIRYKQMLKTYRDENHEDILREKRRNVKILSTSYLKGILSKTYGLKASEVTPGLLQSTKIKLMIYRFKNNRLTEKQKQELLKMLNQLKGEVRCS